MADNWRWKKCRITSAMNVPLVLLLGAVSMCWGTTQIPAAEDNITIVMQLELHGMTRGTFGADDTLLDHFKEAVADSAGDPVIIRAHSSCLSSKLAVRYSHSPHWVDTDIISSTHQFDSTHNPHFWWMNVLSATHHLCEGTVIQSNEQTRFCHEMLFEAATYCRLTLTKKCRSITTPGTKLWEARDKLQSTT